MSTLPNLPSLKVETHEDVEASTSSPFTEESVEMDSSDSEVNLEKPQYVGASDNNDNEVKVLIPKKGIEVVALRKGFYNQMRYKDGDKFLIKSEKDLGNWMRCIDPVLEKQLRK